MARGGARARSTGTSARDGRARAGAPATRVALGRARRASPSRAASGLVHEDDAILVVDKPPRLLTIATERERERTAYRLLWDYLAAPAAARAPVHRPPARPRDVGAARLRQVRRRRSGALQAQFEARTVERVYVALVEGRVPPDERGTLESRLVGGPRAPRALGARRRAASGHHPLPGARRAAQDTTLLELALGTGRRHQIRVQLAAIGPPDRRRPRARRAPGQVGRLCLHATRLGFVHPATAARMSSSRARRPPTGYNPRGRQHPPLTLPSPQGERVVRRPHGRVAVFARGQGRHRHRRRRRHRQVHRRRVRPRGRRRGDREPQAREPRAGHRRDREAGPPLLLRGRSTSARRTRSRAWSSAP